MSQPSQAPIPQHTPAQPAPPQLQQPRWPQQPPPAGSAPQPWQGAVPPQQWQRPGRPVRPGFPVVSRPPRGNGWWIASTVLAFLGACSAVSVFGVIAFIDGLLGLFVAAQGGEEGLRQISEDFVHTTSGLFYLFLGIQLVMIVLGFWAGRNCLRGKTSGALMTMLVGALGVGEVVWLGIAFDEPGRMALGIVAGLALIVCPVIALRFPQPRLK